MHLHLILPFCWSIAILAGRGRLKRELCLSMP